jgi:hypothetical protein
MEGRSPTTTSSILGGACPPSVCSKPTSVEAPIPRGVEGRTSNLLESGVVIPLDCWVPAASSPAPSVPIMGSTGDGETRRSTPISPATFSSTTAVAKGVGDFLQGATNTQEVQILEIIKIKALRSHAGTYLGTFLSLNFASFNGGGCFGAGASSTTTTSTEATGSLEASSIITSSMSPSELSFL